MKKLALLLSVVFMAACGGSGGGSNNASLPAGTGKLTVKVAESAAKTVVTNTAGTSQNWRRLVITNDKLNAGGYIFQKFVDYDRAGAAPPYTFDLPYANGYVIEVLDYTRSTSVYNKYSSISNTKLFAAMTSVRMITTTKTPYGMTDYGRAEFNFTGAVTTVSIKLNTVATRIPFLNYTGTVYSSITPGNVYSARVTFVNMTAAPFNPTLWGLKEGSLAGVDTAYIKLASSPTLSGLAAPYTMTESLDSYYGKAVFYAKNSLILRDPVSNAPIETFDSFLVYGPRSAPADIKIKGGTVTISPL
jgi:hypothetical protein